MSTKAEVTSTTEVLSDVEYEVLARSLISAVEAQVDAWLQHDVVDIDSSRTGGLLELSFPNGSKIIINMQPPLKEIWLAARSGGFHYRYARSEWRDTKSDENFFDVLSRCATEQAGKVLVFKPVV